MAGVSDTPGFVADLGPQNGREKKGSTRFAMEQARC